MATLKCCVSQTGRLVGFSASLAFWVQELQVCIATSRLDLSFLFFFLKIAHISFCFLKYDYICVCFTQTQATSTLKDQRAACRISSSLQPCKSKGVNSGCQAWPLHTEPPPQHHTFLIKATSWCGFGCCDSWYNANFYHVSRVDHCSTGFGV